MVLVGDRSSKQREDPVAGAAHPASFESCGLQRDRRGGQAVRATDGLLKDGAPAVPAADFR